MRLGQRGKRPETVEAVKTEVLVPKLAGRTQISAPTFCAGQTEQVYVPTCKVGFSRFESEDRLPVRYIKLMIHKYIYKVFRTMTESIRELAESEIKEKKREKLKDRLGKKLQELEQAEKTVEKLEEEVEELESMDVSDVELDSRESPF